MTLYLGPEVSYCLSWAQVLQLLKNLIRYCKKRSKKIKMFLPL